MERKILQIELFQCGRVLRFTPALPATGICCYVFICVVKGASDLCVLEHFNDLITANVISADQFLVRNRYC